MNRKKNKKRKQIGRKVYENHTIAAGIRHLLNRNLAVRRIKTVFTSRQDKHRRLWRLAVAPQPTIAEQPVSAVSRGDTYLSETHCKLRRSAAVGQASPHTLLVPQSGTDYTHRSVPLRGTIYGRDEVAHVPTAALLRSLQWVSDGRSRSAEPAAHTQSAGRSWVRGYGGTP